LIRAWPVIAVRFLLECDRRRIARDVGIGISQ
jgi:hypothetical protein